MDLAPRNRLGDPIFQDIPDEINEDWNHGVLVGGMASSDHLIAQAYKKAGDVLVRQGLESRMPYEVAYPICYLYRHCIELYLKLLVNPVAKDHDLSKLIQEFNAIYKSRTGQSAPSWVNARLRDFNNIDPGSFSFRYAYDKKGKFSIGEESWVELEPLRQVVTALCEGFERML